MRRRFLTYYRDPLAGDDQGGNGGDQGGTGGDQGAGAADGSQGAAGDQGGQGGNLLAGDQGAGGDPEIPEKFLVKGADGQTDYKSTFGKMSTSYRELEQRLGAVGMPPKTAAEYKLDKYLPEGFEEKPEALAPLLDKFHALGLTNKQLQGTMEIFGQQLGAAHAQEQASYNAAAAKLKEQWGGDFDQNLTHARAAVAVYGSTEERQALLSNPKYYNDPVLLAFLAKVGADLGEDRIPQELGGAGGVDVEALRTSPAYRDKKHPEHKATVEAVNRAYAAGYKSKK